MFMRNLCQDWRLYKWTGTLLLLIIFLVYGNAPVAFAHGGEDHGDSKSKTTADVKGTISHMARLGDLEVMIKHVAIEPDTAATARLFITNFQTNAPADKISPAVEIESASGSVTPVTIQKTDSTGSFNLKIPALPAGTYILHSKVTYAGETDTATFSGVKVENPPTASEGGTAAWVRQALFALSGIVILGMFGGLIYYALRTGSKNMKTGEEVVSV
jgi:hypothetical protein